ncbi:MAG: regulatory protein RecX [Dehalococcoidia bacterium]
MRLSEIAAERDTPTQSSVLSPQSSDLRISAIERQERRQRYNVFVDGEFALALAPEVLAGSGLRTGEPVTAERLRELAVEDLRKRTLDAALRLLAARPRSEAEVRQRLLRRGLPHDVIVDTIARLREYGYLNDAEFARFWVESRSGANPRGRYVVRRELRAKGVDQETVDTALEGLTEEASAAKAARKKARSLQGLEHRVFYTRLTGYLVRRGFGYEVVRQTVNDLWKSMNGGPPDETDWSTE